MTDTQAPDVVVTEAIYETKSVGQLTDDERERLNDIVEWYECPACQGDAVNYDCGKFCIACTNRGKLLSPTANIIAAMMRIGWNDRLSTQSAMQARIEELEAALRPFAELAEVVGKGKWLDEAGFTLMHHHEYAGCVKLCELRAARATLSNIGGSNDG